MENSKGNVFAITIKGLDINFDLDLETTMNLSGVGCNVHMTELTGLMNVDSNVDADSIIKAFKKELELIDVTCEIKPYKPNEG